MQNAKSLKFILGVIGVIGIIGATKKVEQSRSTLDFRNIFTPKKSQSERFLQPTAVGCYLLFRDYHKFTDNLGWEWLGLIRK